ncbi:hypothetical protein [Nocardiopsis kunsanensis]|uniref:hypothetical protein n=1 Tax=Nocardiopsis kunsanensis TaxID=141693 RepID=UPI001268FE51|nr:hypothetical protein [Nocardiopsis kunsanensis]
MAKKNELVSLRRGGDEREERRPSRPQLVDYLRPWVAAPLLIPAGFLTHWLWGEAGWVTGLASAAITAAGGVVTYATHQLTAARTWYAHHIATAMVGTATGWLALATAFGPGRPLMDALLLGGAALAGVANVHLWAAGQGTKEETANKPTIMPWAKVKEILHLRGVSMRLTKQTDAVTQGRLEFENGATVETLQARRKELASLYKVAPGAVRITEHPERADWGEITIITRNVMKELIPWPGLDDKHVGASLADGPIGPLGLYEDGTEFIDDLEDRHTLTVGMSGSGKSVYGKIKILNIAARRDAAVLALDVSKGRQTLGPVQNALAWTAFEKKSAKAMLKAIERAATARADYLGSKGLPNWTKKCGLTFLHILVEEAADLVDADELVKLGRMCRSAGIHLEVSLQRATFTNLDTDTRSNLGDSVCFGVRTADDASFALPDHVQEAGAEPERWQNYQPGSAFAVVREADEDRHAMPIKMFGPPTDRKEDENKDLSPAAEALPDQAAKIDPITRKAFGEPFEDWLAARENGAPALAAVQPDEDTDEEEDEVEEEDGEYEEDEMEPIVLDLSDDDPEVIGDLNTEVAPVDGEDELVLSQPRKGTKASAEEARAGIESLIHEWGPGHTFRITDLKTELAEMGISRGKTWFYDQVQRLEDGGSIAQDDEGNWTVQETRDLASV